ncbi:uncharacterized protein LOC113465455 [Diaphorina citri]|uniref:Uncharacterized protein LOC113465455 n=1 Tax=Diaphorina citri TaxID=121845 RepID=A0A3Q0INB7_DIACI|nr:uncharacterized protein LOC113465455 [Diaphorina citri]
MIIFRYALEFPKDSLKISSALCIQDPYDLSHNITKAVNHSTLSLLQHNIEIIWILQRHSPARLLLACLEDHNAERDTQLENYAKQNETMRLQRLLAACEEKKKAREKNALADKAQGNASSLKKQEARERGHATGNTKEKDTDSRKPPDTRDRAPATGQTESPRDTPETRRASRPLPEDPNATRGTGRKSPDGAVSRKTLIITNSKLGSTAHRKNRHRDASSSQSREESGSEDRNSKPGGRENRPGNDRVGREQPNGESKDSWIQTTQVVFLYKLNH